VDRQPPTFIPCHDDVAGGQACGGGRDVHGNASAAVTENATLAFGSGCSDGYGGPRCHHCAAGHARAGAAACSECQTGAIVGLAMFGAAVVGVGGIAFLVRGPSRRSASRATWRS
jgi:hypothetical protein